MFDSVVVVDLGVEYFFCYVGVNEGNVELFVYGVMFMCGLEDLKSIVIFVGGFDVELGEWV